MSHSFADWASTVRALSFSSPIVFGLGGANRRRSVDAETMAEVFPGQADWVPLRQTQVCLATCLLIFRPMIYPLALSLLVF